MLHRVVYCLLLLIASAVVVCPAGLAQDKKEKRTDRQRWEWRMTDSKGNELEKGTFVGYQTGEKKTGKKQVQIGTWKKVGKEKVSLTFTLGRLEGSTELRVIKANPPTLEGELVRKKEGDKVKLHIVIYSD
jgi:hypothetical protein